MTRQWKQSIEQTDIVSDGQAFNGADIDQPLSNAGGAPFDPATLTWELLVVTGNSSKSVSGSGWIAGWGSTWMKSATMKIDGTVVTDVVYDDNVERGLGHVVAKFDNSLTLDANTNVNVVVAYGLE